MHCEDNSKLRIPLDEACASTDIGCVPEVSGKPGCNPQPDQLPLAFDPSSSTLWLFSCKTREWVSMSKFKMCELNVLNLDNITNICDILNIGVYFNAGNDCQQGTVTLAELAEKILDCLKLETKIITIGEGEGNKLKITIDGLPLDPVYVQGKNIWSEGGSGTESDPLIVATHDPICKWPAKTQEEVESAEVAHIGACLDGNMVRIPLPKDMYKEYVPTPEYLCIPFVAEAPVNPPAYGTGPVRAGCNGRFWFWLCNEEKWVEYSTGKNYEGWDTQRKIIADHCENVKFHGWSKQGECEIDFEISPVDLWELLDNCAGVCSSQYLTEEEVYDILDNDPGRVRNVICVDGNTTVTDYKKDCCPVVKRVVDNAGGAMCISIATQNIPVVWESRTSQVIKGQAEGATGHSSIASLTVKNDLDTPALLRVEASSGTSVVPQAIATPQVSGAYLFAISEDENLSYDDAIVRISGTAYSEEISYVEFPQVYRVPEWNTEYVHSGIKTGYIRVLQVGETCTLYCHNWVILNNTGTIMFHVYTKINGFLFGNYQD